MADDTPSTGETATPGNVSNDVSTTAPNVDNSSAVASLSKEQIEMRANQIANSRIEEARKKLEDELKAQRLKEKEEFKTLYEQTQSKLDEFEARQNAEQKRQSLAKTTEELLGGYDEKVVKLAKTAGLALSEDTDEARNALKEKLEAFKAEVSPSNPRVTSNNPSSPAPITVDRASLTARAEDGSSPMAIAGAKGDESVSLQYIRSLPAVQRMKEISQQG